MTRIREIQVNVTSNGVRITTTPRPGSVNVSEKRIRVRCDKLNVQVTPNEIQPIITQVVRTPVIRAVQLELVTLAVTGQRGADGSGAITVPFEWNSISILPITVAVFDKAVLTVSVCLVEAFNGIGASLSVGDSGDHERLLASTLIDPGSIATFTVHPGDRYSSSTQVNLYITPGSASTGSGVVSIEMEQ